jgi:hypothetical protein
MRRKAEAARNALRMTAILPHWRRVAGWAAYVGSGLLTYAPQDGEEDHVAVWGLGRGGNIKLARGSADGGRSRYRPR